MSKRRDPELVEDISEAITRIERYTAGLTLDAFLADTKTQDATVRNLEIIGEAVKGLSSEFRKKHQSAVVNWDIVWDVLRTKLPELRRHLARPEESRK